jgi:2,4-dienoyl-CoA reductase-like NADH-dependent reductase (Old Yellow Enzyme family)
MKPFGGEGMDNTSSRAPLLLQPYEIREVRLKNRMVLAPMQMYSAKDGFASEWHVSHLAKFAVGGFGTVFTEALCVEPRGRNTYGDMGIWSDDFIPSLRRIADTIRACGAVPATQLVHCGPKAGRQRPWEGYGPLGAAEAARGEPAWQPVAPSAEAKAEGWHKTKLASRRDIQDIIDAFANGARRCAEAGFDILDIHGAHGYLIHSFYSPLGNDIEGEYGGDRAQRMRFALEIAEAVRANWPDDKPIFYRLSCVDGADVGGWAIEDTVVLAKELQERGIDLIDCSSGGIGLSPTAKIVARQPMFQVPYSERVRRDCPGLATIAVGLITEAEQAESILRNGQADLVMIAREALYNPNWALQAAVKLGGDPQFNESWPPQYGWWLYRRARTLELGKQERAAHRNT